MKQQILASLKLKEFADDNSRFDENVAKFSLENTVIKEEIALFPQCFLEDSTADTLKQGLVWKKVNNL